MLKLIIKDVSQASVCFFILFEVMIKSGQPLVTVFYMAVARIIGRAVTEAASTDNNHVELFCIQK